MIIPLAGTVTLNQTSPPEYPAQPGTITPVVPVAAALVYCEKEHVEPTGKVVALQGSSLPGCANTDIHESNRSDILQAIRDV